MLTSTLENVLNRGLPRSPRAQQLCAELAGRKVAIVPGMAPFGDHGRRVVVESNGDSLKLSVVSAEALASAPADATLSGGALSLLALSGSTPEARAPAR